VIVIVIEYSIKKEMPRIIAIVDNRLQVILILGKKKPKETL
jgi:hypothetical protein